VIAGATDEALVRRAASGQREAFEELVRRHRARVFALALRICRDHDDAEDALQETFIAAYRALPRFDQRARVSTWLYRIATNKCYDVLARRRPTADSAALPEAADPHDPFAHNRRRELLTQALDELPAQFREAALLCDVCGLTPA
jgi:RNA polymerase sigma-70 factor (ECF subfamily)